MKDLRKKQRERRGDIGAKLDLNDNAKHTCNHENRKVITMLQSHCSNHEDNAQVSCG